ncbi:hypothetical protein RR48_07874 [Papilio machaon]|uniref:Uncharacterized protein n=1 Tax=Papilio machaon TaxID=76193 RepID=A0A194QU23_PAPMA|nr:hypothetical protein RR48_07874 [Papilio machaon]
MSTTESNEQIEYIIGEVINRLNEILRTSLLIIFAALAVLIVSVFYLLKPLCQIRTSGSVTQVRSCPCFEAILSNQESYKTITHSILKDNDFNPRKIANDGIKFNSNLIVEKQEEKVTASKDSCQGTSESNIDEDFIREIGLPECFKREVAQAQTDYEEVVGEYSLLQHSRHDVETTTKNNLHYCDSCQRMLKSQGVQSEAKKNIIQRLLRSIKCIPEPKLPRLEYKKKN